MRTLWLWVRAGLEQLLQLSQALLELLLLFFLHIEALQGNPGISSFCDVDTQLPFNSKEKIPVKMRELVLKRLKDGQLLYPPLSDVLCLQKLWRRTSVTAVAARRTRA